MRINYDAKLNFEDVLLQPKRSTLSSRKDVDMTRNFTFRNSGRQMNFLPDSDLFYIIEIRNGSLNFGTFGLG